MPEILSASIVFPLLNFALRTVQIGYELAGVSSETADHLKTIKQVVSDIDIARTLRNQKLACLSENEILQVDSVIKNTEEALAGLQELIEPARVDMELHNARVRPPACVMWVMRDSGKANAALKRLYLAGQSLHSQIIRMELKHVVVDRNDSTQSPMTRMISPSLSDYGVSDPSYLLESTKAFADRRERLQRRFSGRTEQHRHNPQNPPQGPARSSVGYLPLEQSRTFVNAKQKVEDWIRENEETLSNVDPSFAVSRNEILRARVVDDVPYPVGCSELDGMSLMVPTARSLQSTSMPSSPYLSARSPRIGAGTSVHRGQSSSPVVSSIARMPSSYSTPNVHLPSVPVQQRFATPSARSTTAPTPGRRGERLLTWTEPVQEEQEGRSVSQALSRSHTPETPPPYTPHPLNASSSESASQPRESSSENIMHGRRRARLFNGPNQQDPVSPNVPVVHTPNDSPALTARSLTVRSHRSRPSYAESALAAHEAEAASIVSRQRSWD